MKKFWLGIVGLAAASTTHAAIVTYTVSRGEVSNGAFNAAAFTVYATVAPGANSFGLFAYGVDLGGVPFAVTERAPGGTWNVDDQDVNWDPVGNYPARSGGFTILRETSPTGAVSGAMNPSAYNVDPAKNNLVIVKGIGQTAGNMNSIVPPPYTNTDGTTVGSKPYNPITDSDSPAYGTPRNNAFSPVIPAGSVRLFTGSISSGTIDQLIVENTLDTKAGVFKDNDPNSIDTEANNTINIVYRNYRLTAGGVNTFTVSNTPLAGATQQAVGGNIAVTGSNNKYVSEVDQLIDPSVNKGTASVQTIGDEGGFLWVMAKVIGVAGDVTAIQTAFNNGAGLDSATATALHNIYDSQFGPGGFNLLYRQANIAGAKNVNWDFAANTGATIDQMAVVPEPATMGLMAFAGLGLAARRRRKA